MRGERVGFARRVVVAQLADAGRSKADGFLELPGCAAAHVVDDRRHRRQIRVVQQHPAARSQERCQVPPVQNRVGETVGAVHEDEIEPRVRQLRKHVLGASDVEGHTRVVDSAGSARLANSALLVGVGRHRLMLRTGRGEDERARTCSRLQRAHSSLYVLLEPAESLPSQPPELLAAVEARRRAAQRLREGTGHERIIARIPKRRALIAGVGGQDGSFLAELLLSQGYEVAGIVRRQPSVYASNLGAVLERIELVDADLLDRPSLNRALEETRPHEVFNLAAPSFVPRSWDEPVLTAEFAAVGVTSLLEAIRAVDPDIRFYQASSSEIFGRPLETPQTEETPLSPVTPYGVAKAYGHFIAHSYRDRYGLFACCGILYNHESIRRPLDFLPRKVARAAAAISLGLESTLRLGDLDARRDWGYAPDYVRAMWLMLQQDEPQDYIVASGESRSVRDLVACAFARVGLEFEPHVVSDPAFRRGVAELHDLVGDPNRAREVLGWTPSVTFEELVGILVDAELQSLSHGQAASSA